jgi:hypothetical protein
MRKLFPLLAVPVMLVFLFVLTSCFDGGESSSTSTVKAETVKADAPKPKRPILPEELMPAQILDPNIFPLFSDLYKGGLKIDTDSKVYIWNGCRMSTMTNDDYYEATDYWRITVSPGADWFGWGMHHYPSNARDLRGFEKGYLHFAMKSTPKSGTIKIGIKSGYMNESWIAFTNGVYGFEYDNEWHVIDIPFRDFLPTIRFGAINAFFMVSQQQTPAVFGSVYYFDQIVYVKNTNIRVQNIDVEGILASQDAPAIATNE